MYVFAVYISTAFGQSLTRRREPTWNTYNFRIFYRTGQKPIGRRTLRYSNLDTCTVDFGRIF